MQMWNSADLPWDVTMLPDGTRNLPRFGWTHTELAGFAAKRETAWKAACAKQVQARPFLVPLHNLLVLLALCIARLAPRLVSRLLDHLSAEADGVPTVRRAGVLRENTNTHQFVNSECCLLIAAGAWVPAAVDRARQGAAAGQRAAI